MKPGGTVPRLRRIEDVPAKLILSRGRYVASPEEVELYVKATSVGGVAALGVRVYARIGGEDVAGHDGAVFDLASPREREVCIRIQRSVVNREYGGFGEFERVVRFVARDREGRTIGETRSLDEDGG